MLRRKCIQQEEEKASSCLHYRQTYSGDGTAGQEDSAGFYGFIPGGSDCCPGLVDSRIWAGVRTGIESHPW